MLVSGFTEVGLSTRAIANILGVSDMTVRRDQRDEASTATNVARDAKPKTPTKGLDRIQRKAQRPRNAEPFER